MVVIILGIGIGMAADAIRVVVGIMAVIADVAVMTIAIDVDAIIDAAVITDVAADVDVEAVVISGSGNPFNQFNM